IATVTDTNRDQVLVHDAHHTSPARAFALTRLTAADLLHHTPIGVIRNTTRPVYDRLMAGQLDQAVEQKGPGDLAALLAGTDTWTVN
ncbi:2-oxoacid:ferredoxin oxidoreductase subunit beta, partial [Kitasatospora sp. NPDC002227]